jgi:hypothetical protein
MRLRKLIDIGATVAAIYFLEPHLAQGHMVERLALVHRHGLVGLGHAHTDR